MSLILYYPIFYCPPLFLIIWASGGQCFDKTASLLTMILMFLLATTTALTTTD